MNRTHLRVATALVSLFAAHFSSADMAMEPYSYHQDFETREECAWASYPLWQDTAFDPNFRPHEIVPGDPNISLEQMVTPYTSGDAYAGAQKRFDAWLVPGSSIRLRYYLKSHLPFESFTVRIAAGPEGKVDFTIPNPKTNRWEWVTVSFGDFIGQNPKLAGKSRLKVNALAALAKAPGGDPSMPLYLGLDDITLTGMRPAEFRFGKPMVHELAEWKPRIAQKHCHAGERFELEGTWPCEADAVKLSILAFTDRTKQFLAADLKRKGNAWAVDPFVLTFPRGMYLAVLTAYRDAEPVAESRLSFIIAPEGIGGKHPRLWFDAAKKEQALARLRSDRFRAVDQGIDSAAASARKRSPLESVYYIFEQMPDENAMPTWDVWVGRQGTWGGAVYANALAYSLHGDREAGLYAKNL
ncbi:MAG: hypothetical protein ACYC9O_12785, partial [Candidatus Latescibacterota bacterium]